MRKILKKVTAFFLVLSVTAHSMPITVLHAADAVNVDMKLSKTTELKAGDILTMDINFSENAKAVGGNIDIQYDANFFKPVYEFDEEGNELGLLLVQGDIVPKGMMFTGDHVPSKNEIRIAFADAKKEIVKSGTLATVQFEVKENVYGTPEFLFTRTRLADINVKEMDVVTNDPIQVSVPKHLQKIALSSETLNLVKGDAHQLSVNYDPSDTTDSKTVTWSSSDASVASVDANGLVSAVKSGKATITAKVGNHTANSMVTVTNPIQSISFDKAEYSVVKNQSLTLTPTLDPEDADPASLTWESSNPKVASVANGIVTPIQEGSTTIHVKCGNISATTKVVVKEIHIDKVEVLPKQAEVLKGKTIRMTANIDPADTTDDVTTTWVSSDESIATVNEQGVVTGIGEGQVTITAQAGTKTASADITVKEIHIDSIILNTVSAEVLKGEQIELLASIHPEDTTDDKMITWTSSDPTIATVENGIVTGLQEGTVTISAKAGKVEAKATVRVKEIHIDGISMSATEVNLLKGWTQQLTATLTPENTTDSDKTIIWSSKDESIATVDQDGKVTALKEGTTIITAKHGMIEGTTKIHVKEIHIDEITMNITSASMKKGEGLSLEAIFKPENITDEKTITWNSSNPKVASVDANGKVIALTEGETLVTATIAGKTVECKITVIEKHIDETSVVLAKNLITVKAGEPYLLENLLKIDTTDTYSIKYEIEDESIAKIHNDQLLAIGTGNTTLTISIESAYAKVTKKVQITSVVKEVETNTENTVEETPKQESDNGIVPTGASTNVALCSIMAILAGTAIVVSKKKKSGKAK